VAGDINEEQIFKFAQKYFVEEKFNKRGKNFKVKERVVEKQIQSNVKLKYKKTDQAHIALGVRTFDYLHQDNNTLKLLSVILGGSMSSRLFINLRERNGLAYYVFANQEKYTDCGYLSARAGVQVEKVEQSIQIILAEFEKLKNEVMAESELQKIKDMITGKLAINLEASDNVVNWYANQAIMINTIAKERELTERDKKIFTPEELIADLKKITVADIQCVARNIFKKENLNLAIIGPFKDEEKFIQLLK
jgi:predicted Zn-dependent peptidase